MNEKSARDLIAMNRSSYDQMAAEFSASRARFWDELAFLAEHAAPDTEIIDIGCGNGRFYPLMEARKVHYVGVDNSEGLLAKARAAYPDARFALGDATKLPFPDQSFDTAFSFATLHHIPSKKLRTQFVREAARILHPGSTFVLTVWDLWQPKYVWPLLRDAFRGFFRLAPLEIGDTILTFGKHKHARYLHAFTERELRRLLEQNGFEVLDTDITARPSGAANIVAVSRKKGYGFVNER